MLNISPEGARIIIIRNCDQQVTGPLTPRQASLYLWGLSVTDYTIHVQGLGVYVPVSADVTSLEKELTERIEEYERKELENRA